MDANSEKAIVKFIKPWGAYTKGDIAGFLEDTADNLVKAKVAEPYEPDNAEVEGAEGGDDAGGKKGGGKKADA